MPHLSQGERGESMRRTSKWLLGLIVASATVVAAFIRNILENWFYSRLDEQITARTPMVKAFFLKLAKWAIENPALFILLLAVALLALVQCAVILVDFLRRSKVSIHGADYYMAPYLHNGNRYLVVTDVTITNHDHNKAVSIGAEYAFEERLGEHIHIHRCTPEISAVPDWERSRYYPKNKPLFFPLNIDPGKTERGYVAFSLGRPSPTPLPGYLSHYDSGELRFLDYQTGRSLKTFKKTLSLLPGGFPSELVTTDDEGGATEKIASGKPEMSGPIRIKAYGGPDATLVVYNDGKAATFTGEGHFVTAFCDAPVRRQRPWRVMWQQPTRTKTDFDNIGTGHFGTIVLLEATFGTADHHAHIAAWGDNGGVEAWEFDTRATIGIGEKSWFDNLKSIRISISLIAQPPLETPVSKAYDITWNGQTRLFAVTEVTP